MQQPTQATKDFNFLVPSTSKSTFNLKRNHGNVQSTSDQNCPQNVKKLKVSNEGRLEIDDFMDFRATLQKLKENHELRQKDMPRKYSDEMDDYTEHEVPAKIKTQPIQKVQKVPKPSNFKKQSSYRIPKAVTNRNVVPLKPQGSFYGLSKNLKTFLLQIRGISKLYEWQEQCLSLKAVEDRTNLIYSTPTSGGKTLVSEILMLREVLLRKRNVIFIVPYVSIVQEKVQEMMSLAVEFDFLIEEYCAGKGSLPPVKRRNKNSIYICTIEKGQILLDSLLESKRIAEVSLVVVDELHMLGDSHRGHILESFLTKIIYLEHIPIQIVGMSATISNLDEISDFLAAESFTYDFRPIELKEFLKTGTELYKINHKATNPSGILKKTEKVIGRSYTPEMLKRDTDHIGYFVYKAAMESSCLIFCATKVNCENVALLIAECLPKELMKKKNDEKKDLIAALKSDFNGGICPTLNKTIPFGVAYHHSGLTSEERKRIEDAFHSGILTVICCTSTLAAGVNLPASRVIIRAPYVGRELITLSQYKQMIGRAGRAGKSEKGDSILMCDKKDFEKVANMLTSKMEDTFSAYLKDTKYVKELIINLIGTGLCKNFEELHDYSKCMLSRVQQDRFDMDMKTIFIDKLKELLEAGQLNQKFQSKKSKRPSILTCLQDQIVVYAEDHFEINKVGKAAVKSGMTYEDASQLHIDLTIAHTSLVLSQCLHLMYIVAPKEAVDSIYLDYKNYSDIFLKLDSSMLSTARVIGIDEILAVKMIRNPNFQGDLLYMIKKFYVALILYDLWNGQDLLSVSKKYKVNRGIVHKLMYAASSQAYSIFKFCEVYDEFWIFKEIMEQFSKRLAYCCSTELLPLMELPNVKIARAKMMYAAGLRTIADIAAITSEDLVRTIKNINKKQADQVVRAAKNTMNEQIDTLKVQMYEMQKVLRDAGQKNVLDKI
ncbi:unnamed protein product [Chironomus riparius]|uniref:Uncharacterized protein n=1 Tax=Chironomus riparius TaxID=315576 RepID=A0A9N9RQY3_9DIPT|nr:unnamed protein product [Chironomus riparius]